MVPRPQVRVDGQILSSAAFIVGEDFKTNLDHINTTFGISSSLHLLTGVENRSNLD